MTVISRKKARNEAYKLFLTDYELDTIASQNAGSSIYRSTVQDVTAWISDLWCTLALNMAGYVSENIYKVFVTKYVNS